MGACRACRNSFCVCSCFAIVPVHLRKTAVRKNSKGWAADLALVFFLFFLKTLLLFPGPQPGRRRWDWDPAGRLTSRGTSDPRCPHLLALQTASCSPVNCKPLLFSRVGLALKPRFLSKGSVIFGKKILTIFRARLWNLVFSKFLEYKEFPRLSAFLHGMVYGGLGRSLLTRLWPTPTDIKTLDPQPTANSSNLQASSIWGEDSTKKNWQRENFEVLSGSAWLVPELLNLLVRCHLLIIIGTINVWQINQYRQNTVIILYLNVCFVVVVWACELRFLPHGLGEQHNLLVKSCQCPELQKSLHLIS